MSNYLKNMLIKFKQLFLSNKTIKCKHLNRKEIYRDYPDRYIEYKCLECGEKIYEDMD